MFLFFFFFNESLDLTGEIFYRREYTFVELKLQQILNLRAKKFDFKKGTFFCEFDIKNMLTIYGF
jgi:hypothetical protein